MSRELQITYAQNGARYASTPMLDQAMRAMAAFTAPDGAYDGDSMATGGYPTQGTVFGGQQGMQLQGNPGHISGYTGPIRMDARGRQYTDYGAYLREDGFYYPAGARISPNGMYFDVGNGWQYAGYATARYDDGSLGKVPSSLYGLAPGTRIDLMDNWNWGGGSADSGGDLLVGNGTGGTGQGGGTGTDMPTAEEIEDYLSLLQYSYNRHIQPGWAAYTQSGKIDF